ncbi:MAG: glycerophosphoryl diester phosphodiesterase [Chitinophagales bacterium]|nr:MAG: glycerophosphoryl diester phosphodiesterase [Chitinophagales bacterium]
MRNDMEQFDVQGHRGARGSYPENSIPGFLYALTAGVHTIEMDVVISKDNQVVVSHEPWMSDKICIYPDGRMIGPKDARKINLYQMTYAEIASFDCGSKGNPDFPGQKPMPVSKPLLSSVIDTLEKTIRQKQLNPVFYNIEVKSSPRKDNLYHPQPEEFVRLLMEAIAPFQIEERITIQSFDLRPLREIRNKNYHVKIALLTAEGRMRYKLKRLGFIPDVYSPHYRIVNRRTMHKAHALGMKVIPWTVNEPKHMSRLIELGVDGIITDYPERLVRLLSEKYNERKIQSEAP